MVDSGRGHERSLEHAVGVEGREITFAKMRFLVQSHELPKVFYLKEDSALPKTVIAEVCV